MFRADASPDIDHYNHCARNEHDMNMNLLEVPF
jgi:hypothetical protein